MSKNNKNKQAQQDTTATETTNADDLINAISVTETTETETTETETDAQKETDKKIIEAFKEIINRKSDSDYSELFVSKRKAPRQSFEAMNCKAGIHFNRDELTAIFKDVPNFWTTLDVSQLNIAVKKVLSVFYNIDLSIYQSKSAKLNKSEIQNEAKTNQLSEMLKSNIITQEQYTFALKNI